MAAENRRAGIIHLKFDDIILQAKGSWTIGMGFPTRTALMTSSGIVNGYKEVLETPPHIKGDMFINRDFDLNALYEKDSATITLELAGQVFVLRGGWLSSFE